MSSVVLIRWLCDFFTTKSILVTFIFENIFTPQQEKNNNKYNQAVSEYQAETKVRQFFVSKYI